MAREEGQILAKHTASIAVGIPSVRDDRLPLTLVFFLDIPHPPLYTAHKGCLT